MKRKRFSFNIRFICATTISIALWLYPLRNDRICVEKQVKVEAKVAKILFVCLYLHQLSTKFVRDFEDLSSNIHGFACPVRCLLSHGVNQMGISSKDLYMGRFLYLYHTSTLFNSPCCIEGAGSSPIYWAWHR